MHTHTYLYDIHSTIYIRAYWHTGMPACPLLYKLTVVLSHRPNGRDGARKQRFGLAVRCALLAQQFVHGLLIDWSSALHFAEEAVDEVRRPLSCR